MLESALTAQPQGRLYKALVESKLAASVSGGAYALHDPGVLKFTAEVNTGNDPQDVLAKLVETIEGVGDAPVTQEEVDRAKARLLKQRELSANDTAEIAVELSEWASMGDWRLYFLYRDRLEAVTPEDVNAAAKAYLRRNNRTVGLFLPTEAPQTVPIPSPPADLAAAIGDYKGREVAALGEAFDVSPAAIEKRVERLTLASGVKATLLEKKTRGDTVAVRLNLRYGGVESLAGHATAAELLPRLMLRGTTTKTRQQIQDELDRLQAQIAAGGTPGVAAFTIKAKRETLPAVLDLLADVLRNPSLPAEELALLKQAEIASAESNLTEPQALATTAVRRAIAPYEQGDPRYVPTLPEQVAMTEAVTAEEVKILYETLLGGTDGELSVVGSFDRDATVAAVEKALSDWTARTKYVRMPQLVSMSLAGRSERIETPDKQNAVYFSATAFPMSNADPAYAPLVIGNFVLGGGSLSSRLGDRVRQQEGLSYGVGSGFSAQAQDERAVLYLYAITNPQNVEKLTGVIAEELAKLLQDGITDAELAAAQDGYLRKQAVSWAEDPTLAQTLAETAENGRTMAYYADLDKQIRSLTPEAVATALRMNVVPAKFVRVVAGDFAKANAEKQEEAKE